MKILIISSTTWDNANSFGNTFSNLFEGMNDVEIYNVACRHGVSNNTIVKRAVQLTDKGVLKSVYKPKFDPCWEIQNTQEITKENQELSQKAKKKRKTTSFIIRDMIWKLGRWKKSKTLKAFLDEVKPDIIYLPIYASPYMCQVQRYIVQKLKVPVVGHISDDVYGYPPNSSLLAKWYRVRLRKKLRKLIQYCSYLEVFAANMKNEYEKTFGKPCYLIGKGIQADEIAKIRTNEPQGQPLHFVYTGNIGDDRYKALACIGQEMSDVFHEKVVLDIYSATPLTEEMKETLNQSDCVKIHGAISREEVAGVQQDADFLVHVEGFSKSAIFSAKMSFSTKIIDYMMMSKPILAFGPREVNSIQVLKENEIGFTAVSQEELKSILQGVLEKRIDYKEKTERIREYLIRYRDIAKIQADIYDRIKKLVKKDENFAD